MKNQNITFTAIVLALGAFAFLPHMLAVSPPPDGCYPGLTTAEGCSALFSLTTGQGNTAIGHDALFSDTTGSWNTGVGAVALGFNDGDFNTAVGTAALLLNTTGTENVAVGTAALINNDSGPRNTAIGAFALFHSVVSPDNCAFGYRALENNDSGAAGLAGANNAFGVEALRENVDGDSNNAFGFRACANNFDGFNNSAFGDFALGNNDSGSNNTAIGVTAGSGISGNGNVCIGAGVAGEAAVNDSTYIRNIATTPQPVGGSVFAVTVNSTTNRLGYEPSSRRYKENIQPMDEASEALFFLNPVTYRFKKNIDPSQSLTYGLIAEDVAKINPNLALRNANGEIESVRYEAINAMLLNEFLKEHRKVQELQVTLAQQQKDFQSKLAEQEKRINALASGLQRVSAQVEMSRPVPQMAAKER